MAGITGPSFGTRHNLMGDIFSFLQFQLFEINKNK